MARPLKQGASYFPLDVDFFADRKIMLVKNRLGFGAAAVVVALYAAIYGGDGYFLAWDEDEAVVIAELIGGGCETRYVASVVEESLKRGIFDGRLFEVYAILTSKGIQRRFLRMLERRDKVTIFDEYLLVNIDSTAEIPVTIRKRLLVISVNADKTCINVAETTVLSTQTPVLTTETPQRKEKEIKENEIKSSSPGPGWEAGRMTTKKIACVMELFPKGTKAAVARSMAESLSGWLEVFPPAVIGKAISISLNYNAFNLKYICNVLKDWQRQELHNIGDVERYLDNFKKGGNGGANAAANSERVKAKHGIMARDFNFADLEIMAMRDAEKRGGIVHNDQ